MPTKVTTEDGKEEIMYSASELEEQRQAAITDFQEKNPDKSGEVTKLTEDLNKAQEALAKFENKDLNFGELRKQKEAAEDKVKKLAEDIDTKIGNAKKEILEGVTKDHYNDTLKSLAGDDEELKKKIEFQYKRLTDPASTKEEVTKKITDAYILATGKPVDEGVLNSSIISSGNVNRIKTNGTQKFTQEEKALANKLAQAGGMTLKDEDFK